MSIKLKVFLFMSVPVFLMIVTQFLALSITYNFSMRLISTYSDNLYLDQQNQMTQLLEAYSFEFSKVFQTFSQDLQAINNFESKILRGEVNLESGFVSPKGNSEKLYQGTEQPQLQTLAINHPQQVTTWQIVVVVARGGIMPFLNNKKQYCVRVSTQKQI